MSVVFLSLLLVSELIQQAVLVNFMLYLNIFKILEVLFLTFWRKNGISLALWAPFSLKPYKAFRIAQCKQLRLVTPCLNADLYFIFKTSGTALLETKVSHKLPANLSQKNRKTLPPVPPDASASALILDCS